MTEGPVQLDAYSILAQRKSLAEELRAAGIGGQAEKLASLARPSLRLEPGRETGQTKVGGRPDLPPGLAWPIRDPIPLNPNHGPLGERERAILARPALEVTKQPRHARSSRK